MTTSFIDLLRNLTGIAQISSLTGRYTSSREVKKLTEGWTGVEAIIWAKVDSWSIMAIKDTGEFILCIRFILIIFGCLDSWVLDYSINLLLNLVNFKYFNCLRSHQNILFLLRHYLILMRQLLVCRILFFVGRRKFNNK